MNQNSSTDLSASTPSTPDAISRRAYEIWENEGRPEGCEMRHWLQAEQELRDSASSANASETIVSTPSRNSDVTPLQGTRAAPAVSAGRDSKRPPTSTAVPNVRNGNGAGPSSGRRRSPSTPAL